VLSSGTFAEELPMADSKLKVAENVAGPYYVDSTCIAAKFCCAVAARNIRMSDGGYAYVHAQPETDEERAALREAMQGCPVAAIGADGG
jgi:ferredoxin